MHNVCKQRGPGNRRVRPAFPVGLRNKTAHVRYRDLKPQAQKTRLAGRALVGCERNPSKAVVLSAREDPIRGAAVDRAVQQQGVPHQLPSAN
eukprot:16438490-Heterocapsa_arctica.AAC.1